MRAKFAEVTLILGTFSFDVSAQKKTKATGSIELTKTDTGKWRYRVKDADGKTIAIPLPQINWDTKKEALKAIDELESILESATPIEAKDDAKDGKRTTTEKKTTEKK